VIANPVIRTVVEVEYAIVRLPLALIARRMPEGSLLRNALDRGLHTLDGVMAGLLATPDTRPAHPAESVREAAPAEELAADLEEERAEIAATILEQEPVVGERADPNLDVAEVQAQLRAKHIVEERLEEEQLKQREQG